MDTHRQQQNSKQTTEMKDTPNQTAQYLQQRHSTYSPKGQPLLNRTALPFKQNTAINKPTWR
ncbi:MAG: hypothetical protein LBH04_03345, partial [Tannerellaceae bacterium]|nr:hypothetical protein [Tannerellaceae bacterium]